MIIRIEPEPDWRTNQMLAVILSHCMEDKRVEFVVQASAAINVVQRLRVALSRSRVRNRRAGRKVEEFTLRHEILPIESNDSESLIAMWIEKLPYHTKREILDDLMERES